MFAKGKSGNPRGRPAGARNKASLMLDKLMERGAQDIVETVIDRAKGGDMTAARRCNPVVDAWGTNYRAAGR